MAWRPVSRRCDGVRPPATREVRRVPARRAARRTPRRPAPPAACGPSRRCASLAASPASARTPTTAPSPTRSAGSRPPCTSTRAATAGRRPSRGCTRSAVHRAGSRCCTSTAPTTGCPPAAPPCSHRRDSEVGFVGSSARHYEARPDRAGPAQAQRARRRPARRRRHAGRPGGRRRPRGRPARAPAALAAHSRADVEGAVDPLDWVSWSRVDRRCAQGPEDCRLVLPRGPACPDLVVRASQCGTTLARMTKAPVDRSSPMDGPLQARLAQGRRHSRARRGRDHREADGRRHLHPWASALTTDLQHKVAATPGMITLRRATVPLPAVVRRQPRRRRDRDRLVAGTLDDRPGAGLRRRRQRRRTLPSTRSRETPATRRCTSSAPRTRSDLEPNFRRNIATAGLTDRVVVVREVLGRSACRRRWRAAVNGVRPMYIDGEHSYERSSRGAQLYAPAAIAGRAADLRRLLDAVPRRGRGDPRAPGSRPADELRPSAVQDDNFLVIRRRV